ncbi:MAG: helix-turn-helix domain-containing protein [Pseudonocardiaceae bacterium]
MPVPCACPIIVTASDRARLKKLVRTPTAAQRDVTQASIVLLATRRLSNNQIAARLRITVDTVCTWRGRYGAEGRDGLADRPRSGRPPVFTPVQVAEVKALACQLPAQAQVPLSVWSALELAREAVSAAILDAVSASTVRRWLAEDAIKPWQHQSWIFIQDPNFRAKAGRVLNLYARTWEGTPLGPDEYVISGACHDSCVSHG